jgi:hypothetical protein
MRTVETPIPPSLLQIFRAPDEEVQELVCGCSDEPEINE